MTINQFNKNRVWTFWRELGDSTADNSVEVVSRYFSDDAVWHGPDPIGELRGAQAFCTDFWQPLMHSFEGLSRQTHVFLGGQSNGRIDADISRDGRHWVSGTGYLHGNFVNDYLSIPASGKPVSIRWGEFCELQHGQIRQVYFLLDLIDLMQQAGYYVLPAARGQDHLYPPPAAGDGLLHAAQNDADSRYSLDHIRRFIFDGLNRYDQSELGSMGMADYFHPELKWYGPGGIGACLSFTEFETLHQRPWLVAFPDRSVQNLDALFAEGPYSAAPGWAGVIATHSGPYLDAPASARSIQINGLDWWKREGERYIENWVFVDMIHLFRQFGIDLFERLRSTGQPRRA